MKNILTTLLFLLCDFAAFGQFDPPQVYNRTSSDTIFERTSLYLTGGGKHGEQRFLVEISRSDKFNLADDQLITHEGTSYVQLKNLKIGTTYFIKAMIISDQGFSRWSQPFEITVSDSVKLRYHRGYFDSQPTFDVVWHDTYADFYKVQFDTVPTFNSPALINDTTSSSFYSYLPPNPFGKLYYRIKPINESIEGKWSEPRFFNGFVAPNIYYPKGQYIHYASRKSFRAYGIKTDYRWQISTDSVFSSIILDTLLDGDMTVTDMDFDTDFYIRVAFDYKGLRSKWSYGTKFRFQGPEFESVVFGSPGSRFTVLYTEFDKELEVFEVEVARDSLFQNPYLFYKDGHSKDITVVSPFPDKKQFIRWRVHHAKDTSSWSSIVTAFKGNLVEPITFNGVSEHRLKNSLFIPNGTLSFASYGADFKKVWVELDVTMKFDSDKKVTLESDKVDVEIPDLHMGQAYFIRYRIAYNDGYEEKEWSSRAISIHTLFRPKSYRNTYRTDFIVRSIEVVPLPDFNGAVQFQLFKNHIVVDDSVLIDTVVTDNKVEVLLPFDTAALYRARLINKVDTSDWTISSNKSYHKPRTTYPLNSKRVTSDSVFLEWKDTSSVCKYTVQIDTQKLQDFAQGSVFDAGRDFPKVPVEPNKTYYWRIMASTRIGSSSWSNVSTFVTDDNSSVPLLPESAVRVYPNPVTTQLTVTSKGRLTAKVLNIQGQVVTEAQGQEMLIINTSALSLGVYIVEVHTVNGIYRQQIEKL